jgi:adenylosuccinate synthase
LSPNKIQSRYGVVKAYTTRVGSGPFPTELLNELGERLQTLGFEIGTTTGRKRRCGWLDLVLLGYSHLINDYTALCLTKLDVLTGFSELKIAVAYELRGERLPSFPANLEDLAEVNVVYETLPGWEEDITGVRSFNDLPANAQAYVKRIEEVIGSPVAWIGVGPSREQMIERN